MHFVDASFLVSAFLGDENGPKAWKWWAKSHVTRLVLLETENAIRGSVFQRGVSQRDSIEALNLLKRALTDGVLVRWELSSQRMYPAAQRICIRNTGPETYGSMDIIHVASAKEFGASHFVSFDRSQRKLADSSGPSSRRFPTSFSSE
jgi:predicted nucleic acid-binding protein